MEDYFDLKLYIPGLRDPYGYSEESSEVDFIDKWKEYLFLCCNLDKTGFVEIDDIREKTNKHCGVAVIAKHDDVYAINIYSNDDEVDCEQICLTYGGSGDKNIGLIILDEKMFNKVISR